MDDRHLVLKSLFWCPSPLPTVPQRRLWSVQSRVLVLSPSVTVWCCLFYCRKKKNSITELLKNTLPPLFQRKRKSRTHHLIGFGSSASYLSSVLYLWSPPPSPLPVSLPTSVPLTSISPVLLRPFLFLRRKSRKGHPVDVCVLRETTDRPTTVLPLLLSTSYLGSPQLTATPILFWERGPSVSLRRNYPCTRE